MQLNQTLKQIRHHINKSLWQHYLATIPHANKIIDNLHKQHQPIVLDHFALIDLPGPHTGIHVLKKIFTELGYVEIDGDYLADKQNDFIWLAPIDTHDQPATTVEPQIVLADFRLDALSPQVREIVLKYSQQAPQFPWQQFHHYHRQAFSNDKTAINHLTQLVLEYCKGRNWKMPTLAEYQIVREANELLSWVLIFGRLPNHFGIEIHHMPAFPDLLQFNRWVTHDLKMTLNQRQGVIKGNEKTSIAQSSTEGESVTVDLADGKALLSGPFIEFVWRYPIKSHPYYWEDYFRGFIGAQADNVIESVFDKR